MKKSLKIVGMWYQSYKWVSIMDYFHRVHTFCKHKIYIQVDKEHLHSLKKKNVTFYMSKIYTKNGNLRFCIATGIRKSSKYIADSYLQSIF